MGPITQEHHDRLVAEFWDAVRSRLISHFKRSADDADRGIGQYRHALEQREVGDIVYNQGVDQAAEVVEGILQHGLPKPTTGTTRKKRKRAG